MAHLNDGLADGIQKISDMQDLADLNDFVADEDFENALAIALSFIIKRDLPPAIAREALIKMQAYAMVFKAKGLSYMTINKDKAGSDNNMKKNIYLSMADQAHELAQTLKYLCKVVEGF